jgi:hypothetical protein
MHFGLPKAIFLSVLSCLLAGCATLNVSGGPQPGATAPVIHSMLVEPIGVERLTAGAAARITVDYVAYSSPVTFTLFLPVGDVDPDNVGATMKFYEQEFVVGEPQAGRTPPFRRVEPNPAVLEFVLPPSSNTSSSSQAQVRQLQLFLLDGGGILAREASLQDLTIYPSN